ncbi:vWA domain-containing protein [Idiomarina sp. HP20-50]|uniref:vWA domain-containing protein n=1 Tax=Idiomarina sp. HP20-50 TaxID=3070813 RepID=UPI00294B72DC|nr:VWA domain-containing protein [Idiomarina sp. HP20-50]MDV6315532.1 VWA domain-containing protein [Idiomarina sp. HP20-50]
MSELHLLRPWWLLALLPVLLLYWRLLYSQKHQAGWHQWLPGHLSKVLVKSGSKPSLWPVHRFLLIAALATIALSGPTWERMPQPVYQLESGQVVIMDMSPSVRASDISPTRLTRMRFKAIDLVRSGLDGDTGLIAYADDAFIISPLTADNRNLINLIPSLSPEIMPASGSEPLRALRLADKLLKNAGYPQGDIYWLTDGVDSRELSSLSDYLRSIEHRVSILAVGTEEGAPVRDSSGRLLKDNNQVVIAKTYPSRLADLASITGGVFTSVTADNQDIKKLVNQAPLTREGKDSKNEQQGDAWRDMGPYIALFILPIILFNWRRGSMLSPIVIALLLPTSLFSPGLRAAQEPYWPQTFLNKEQRAQLLYQNKEFKEAAKLSEKPLRVGSALYRQKDYEAAATAFSQSQSAEAQYNLGNALAQQQNYEAAISAYNNALEMRPEWVEAKENKELVEKLMKQSSKGSGSSDKKSEESDSSDSEKSSNDSEKSDKQSGKQNNNSSNNAGSPNPDESGQKNREPEQSKEEEKESKQEQESSSEQPPKGVAKDENETKQAPNQQLQEKVASGEIDPEKAQQLKQWMNRVPDDPSILLRNKMLLESQRRRQNRASEPQGEDKKW